jgi:hypothetical protein
MPACMVCSTVIEKLLARAKPAQTAVTYRPIYHQENVLNNGPRLNWNEPERRCGRQK